jgi:hypothetical protein
MCTPRRRTGIGLPLCQIKRTRAIHRGPRVGPSAYLNVTENRQISRLLLEPDTDRPSCSLVTIVTKPWISSLFLWAGSLIARGKIT